MLEHVVPGPLDGVEGGHPACAESHDGRPGPEPERGGERDRLRKQSARPGYLHGD